MHFIAFRCLSDALKAAYVRPGRRSPQKWIFEQRREREQRNGVRMSIQQASTARSVHHGLVLVAMLPCLFGAEIVVHIAAALVMYVLCLFSGRRLRRDPDPLPNFIDDVAMFALIFAMLLSGHGVEGVAATGHHGGRESFSIGQATAVVTAVAWTVVRIGLLQRSRVSRSEAAVLGMSAVMVAWMVAALIQH